NDLASLLAGRLHFEQGGTQDAAGTCRLRPTAGGDGLFDGLLLPDVHQHVAVGQPADVVVGQLRVVDVGVIPDELAVPGELLDAAAGAAAEEGGIPDLAGAQQVAVVEEVGAQAGGGVALPRLDDAAVHVDEVGGGGAAGGEQRVAPRRGGVVDEEAEL